MPRFSGTVGEFTPQPINSIVRAKDGTVYLPVDGEGSTSVLFATRDDGKTWFDTGGRTGGRHTTLVLAADGSTLIGMGGKNSEIDGHMPFRSAAMAGKRGTRPPRSFCRWATGRDRV